MRRGWRAAIQMMAGASWVLVVGVAASSSLATAAAKPGKSPELERAVVDLKREYAAHVKDPKGQALRTNCDYFKKGGATCPPDAVVAMLGKPVAGVGAGDLRQAAYVKWQLLSALPEHLNADDDGVVRDMLRAYDHAPVPAARYGSSKQEQKQLDGLMTGARPQDDVQLTASLEEAAARAAAADRPVIDFRDELYRRLPAGRDKLIAGMMDAQVRLSRAAEKTTLADALEEDLRKWATLAGPDRTQVREVAEAFGKLRIVESPPYYAYASVRSGKLGWRTRTDTLLTKHKLAALHKDLLDAVDKAPLVAAGVANPPPQQQPPPQQPAQAAKKSGSKESKKTGNSS